MSLSLVLNVCLISIKCPHTLDNEVVEEVEMVEMLAALTDIDKEAGDGDNGKPVAVQNPKAKAKIVKSRKRQIDELTKDEEETPVCEEAIGEQGLLTQKN